MEKCRVDKLDRTRPREPSGAKDCDRPDPRIYPRWSSAPVGLAVFLELPVPQARKLKCVLARANCLRDAPWCLGGGFRGRQIL